MAEQAKVTSLHALETFRADLIVFMTEAHRAVDEVGDEVRRTRYWIQNDQRTHWEGQARRRKRVLDAAEQELFAAKLSGLRDTTAAQVAAVRKAKAALAEAEDKLRVIKKWNRDFDGCADPLVRGLSSLREFLDQDMPKALAYLVQAQHTLEAYAETGAPAAAATVPETAPPA